MHSTPFLGVDELRSSMRLSYLKVDDPSTSSTLHAVVRSDCSYTSRHLDAAFLRRPGWNTFSSVKEVQRNSRARLEAGLQAVELSMTIDEYEMIDWEVVLKAPHIVTNNFCVRKGLSRKANFAKHMQEHSAKCGDSCPLLKAIPLSVCIDTMPVFFNRSPMIDFHTALLNAMLDAEEAMESAPGALWILKPSLSNKGAEVFIVRDLAEVTAAVKEWRDVGQWVLQRYIANPLLIHERKFHLRVYALADGALRAYVFQEALILSAVEAYDASDINVFAHITNTCVNTQHGGFNEGTSVRCTSEMCELLVNGAHLHRTAAQHRVRQMWQDINAAVCHAFSALERANGSYMPLPNAYELYGVDFVVSSDWQVHLLEFNPTPDIKQTGSRLDYVIAAMIEGAIHIGVDGRFPLHTAPCRDEADGLSRLRWELVYEKAWQASKGPINISFA